MRSTGSSYRNRTWSNRTRAPHALGLGVRGVGRVLDLVLQVEVLEDAVEQRERAVHVGGDLQHRSDREEQPRLQRGERHDVAVVDVAAVREHPAAHQVDQRRRDREERADHGEERTPDHRLADLQPGEALVLLVEPPDLVALSTERLGQQDAADAERLLGDGGHVGHGLLRAGRDLATSAPDLHGEPQEQRHQRQRQEGELHRQDQHRDQRADDRDHVGEHVRGRVGDHVLDTAHVVGQPRLDLAGARRGEEPQGHELQVGVQGVAEILHHTQAHQVGHVRLADADDAGDDRHRDHQAHVQIQQREVGAGLRRNSCREGRRTVRR